jgi:hypothetical protein
VRIPTRPVPRGWRAVRCACWAAGALSLAATLTAAAAPPGSAARVTSYKSDVMGVSAVSASDAWAVGSYFTKVLHWTGAAWKPVSIPPAGTYGGQLSGVDAISAADAWAVGDADSKRPASGTTWALHWNGSRWTRVLTPNPAGAYYSELNAVSGVSGSDLWAVGDYNLHFNSACKALVLHWNGTAWTRFTVPQPYYSCLTGVSAVSAADVWAVGFDSRGTLILHWNGSRWSQVTSPNPGGQGATLSAVSAISATDAWAVGQSGSNGPGQTLTLHWNGSRWSHVASPHPGPTSQLDGISMVSARDGWAAGMSIPNGRTDKNVMLHWNGTSWTQVPAPSPKNYSGLQAVSAVSARDVLAAGWTSPYLHTRNFTQLLRWTGTHWQRT